MSSLRVTTGHLFDGVGNLRLASQGASRPWFGHAEQSSCGGSVGFEFGEAMFAQQFGIRAGIFDQSKDRRWRPRGRGRFAIVVSKSGRPAHINVWAVWSHAGGSPARHGSEFLQQCDGLLDAITSHDDASSWV